MTGTDAELTAAAVRAELVRRKISRKTFGEAFGWSPSSTYRRLHGITPFRVDEITRVAEYLEVPVATLLPETATEAAA